MSIGMIETYVTITVRRNDDEKWSANATYSYMRGCVASMMTHECDTSAEAYDIAKARVASHFPHSPEIRAILEANWPPTNSVEDYRLTITSDDLARFEESGQDE